MIGNLEEQHSYNGDSIETALLVCDSDPNEVTMLSSHYIIDLSHTLG